MKFNNIVKTNGFLKTLMHSDCNCTQQNHISGNQVIHHVFQYRRSLKLPPGY